MRLQPLPIVAGFAALALIVGARAVLVESQRANRAAARETIEYQEQLSGLLSLAQDAESSQRGYLLTGEKSYLEPYRKAVEAIPGQLARIESAATPDDQIVQQISHIKEALSQEQAELSQTIALYDRGDAAKALQLVRSGQGKAAMDEIRASMDTIRRIGAAAVAARDEQTDRVEAWLRIGSLAALLAIFLLGVCTIRQSRRRFRDVLVVQEELMRKNIELGNEIQTRENAESQMRQMQKMEAVGQLTGGIAHDFNNMLAVILSAMNLAQRKLKRGEHDIEKLVEAATDAASRAADLTSRLLAFSRLQPLAPQVVDTNRLLTGMSDLLRRALGEGIRIETVLAGGLWKTHADPSQLENAILNLAVNARDAMDNDGKLTIETVNSHLDEAYASTHAELAPGQYVMIAVTDTGAGMSPEVIAKAFEPFFTTKPANKGTGLGLSQVFGFVKQSGGHVKIYSEPGEGTTIKIYLPRFFGPEEPASPTGRGKSAAKVTETILVVEDDARVRAATTDVMRDLSYTVIHAAGGPEALEKLAATPGIALLFTDIVMPVMNGRKLAEEALARQPGLKVVFTTGFTRNAVVHNGVLDHDVHFLAKPFTIEQLAAKLRDVLDSK
ncbi:MULTISPECIES: CHASE3 domain-containing protein [unclassified Mesorhizobium]|uniref:CHASE3 domain-containing protein n=1 Tax=unclassified Mesorhizobium TaxID=325217 RepID=UPI001093B2CB|nr:MULTISPECIES: CHASE3 domain-containing protein [unclassified Mesorhizobium]TGS45204.1 response regulator [Mesorhizobium sp. M8A.F.Ca.ET.182.01.1.1]TGS80904.1 response regulator [Mesorhizobium sp. M8A.F.Ca.ET.181.01.1.1]TGT46561.1 response regulator [Mesorhizobium sp. M8A.F.Ca.ET.165.01.1.1]TGV58303.1 response regulator [bacterium M00.F.Ca.ET.141.01.1.1]